MKKTLCLSLVLTLALFLSSSTAFAEFRGTFEAPFLEVSTSTEVPGSEGKLNTNGDYKVEIEDVAVGTYQVCIVDNSTNVPYFLEDVILDEDGELKAEGNILDDYVIDHIRAPSFQVRTGSPGDCNGATLVYESGLGLVFGESEDVGPPEDKGPPEGVGPR